MKKTILIAPVILMMLIGCGKTNAPAPTQPPQITPAAAAPTAAPQAVQTPEAADWEEMRTEDPEDPREDLAREDRTVTWFGREVKLVPGTGTGHADGSYAEIDYEGRDWWLEEGFTGRWTLDREQPTDGPNEIGKASLKVMEDGSVLFKLDGEEWTGSLSPVRRYRDSIRMTLERDGESRSCEIGLSYEESYERIHVRCYPGPVPEPQFDPIDVYLVKMPG